MHGKHLITGAATLLAAIAALAVADNARPWRRLQVEFLELERQTVQARLAQARSRVGETVAELEAAVAAEREKLAEHRDESARLEAELRGFRAQLRAAEGRRSAARQALAEARYRHRRAEDSGGGEAAARIGPLGEELRLARMEIEGLREYVEDRERKLGELRAGVRTAEELRALEVAEVETLESRWRELDRGAVFRRLPVAGLFHPSVAPREVSLGEAAPGSVPPRVDRCVTCHLAADREGFDRDAWPAPYRSHPRPELFVAAGSPHPYARFGCSACHGGDGRSTDFSRAGHLPTTPEQEVEWAASWGFERGRLPAEPILPRGLGEAGCAGCHGNEVQIPEVPVHNAGRELVVALGCAGCHPAPRLSPKIPKPGPSLLGVAGKTRPAWVYHWLAAPRAFRPTTWMPHLFPAGGGATDPERRVAERLTIVEYLWQRSRPAADEAPPAGDPAAGRALFGSVGCAACHLLDPDADRERFFPALERLHGPNLARTGSKVEAGWLYTWLRDPRSYRADTPMPSLRLSEREAADLTAYLMSQRDPAWEDLALPSMPVEARDRLVLSGLQEETTIEASHARLDGMSASERNLYLGERTIARHGCPGCHEIAGFEGAEPVGDELDRLAGGLLRTLDLERLVEAFRDGHGWSRPDTDEPPIGSRTAGGPLPDYDLSAREAQAVLVNLLGRRARPPDGVPRPAATSGSALAAGRAILSRYGCRGCHRIEGRNEPPAEGPGTVRGRTVRGQSLTPPELTIEGARVRPAWLYSYLEAPGRFPLRTWLSVRMPTFHLGEAERNALVRYFAERDGQSLFVSDPPAPGEADLAVGRAAFSMLQCDRCHPGATDPGGLDVPALAPSYRRARLRLRPGWVVDWLLDPRRWDPETIMPAHFKPEPDGRPDSSFLVGNIATPIFRAERDRLLRVFDSEEQLTAYLSDPERVASALRDFIWSLDE